METSVLLGAFQPIHKGILQAIAEVKDESDKIVLFVTASNRPRSITNPFTFTERKKLIEDALIDYFHPDFEKPEGWTDRDPIQGLDIIKQVKIVEARDLYYNNEVWANEIAEKARELGVKANGRDTQIVTSMTGNRDQTSKLFPRWKVTRTPSYDGISSSKIRDAYFKGETNISEWLTESTIKTLQSFMETDTYKELEDEYDFIQRFKNSWDNSPYDPHFITVDGLVLCSGHVLLIKRGQNPGKGLWGMPGGYLDVTETLEKSVLRELNEETNIRIPWYELRKRIKKVKVFDHPDRSNRGRIVTHVHLFHLDDQIKLPDIEAGDDAAGAHWVPLYKVWNMADMFFEDHWDIITKMTSPY